MNIIAFVIGLVVGILAMAFLFILNSVHQQFHEIEWHDAQKEKPSLYPLSGDPNAIQVLIHTNKDVIIDSWYYIDCDRYDFEEKESVTHFAYIDELKRTIPPCPVCSGELLNSPYANPCSL